MHERAHAQHIGQRIKRADLMKMHVFHRMSVDTAFGLGNDGIDLFCIFPDRFVKRYRIYKRHDLGNARVLMVMMRFLALLVAVYENRHMRSDYSALTVGCRRQHGLSSERGIHAAQEIVLIRMQLQKRRRQHISGAAHGAVDIQRSHWLSALAFGSSFITPKYFESSALIFSSSA